MALPKPSSGILSTDRCGMYVSTCSMRTCGAACVGMQALSQVRQRMRKRARRAGPSSMLLA